MVEAFPLPSHKRNTRLRIQGLTLLELLFVVAVLVALAGIVLPLVGRTTDDAAETTTRATLAALRDAIMGTDRSSGYIEDLREWPPKIHDLLSNDRLPTAKQKFDINTHFGWQGPYIRSTDTVYTIDLPHGFTGDYCYAGGVDHAVVDAWNHPIVIQFITAPLNPGDAPVRLVSAGSDGILNTTAASSGVVGDDIILPLKRAGQP